jgi:hypothetical protein
MTKANVVFWDVTQYSVVDIYIYFGATCYLHHQGTSPRLL